MLDNLLFSLNNVMPYFLLIVAGALLRKTGKVPVDFFRGANSFTFRVALPFLLFCNITDIEFTGEHLSFQLYVLCVTVASFIFVWITTELLFKDKTMVGTLVQGAFRGNFVLLGVPLASSVLGESARRYATLASIIVIPAYNALSIIILSVRGKSEHKDFLSVMKSILSNPLIIGIIFALPFMALKIKIPEMLMSTMKSIGSTGTPLGLLSIGGLLSISDATARLRPSLYSSCIKNLILPAVVVAVSCLLGYSGPELLVLFIMAAAPGAISSYIMASEMGGDLALASNILIISTFFSGFVLAIGIYLLRTFGLI